MKRTLIAATLLAALTACSTDTDLVKDGVMDFNKTTTVGKALDNWKSCEKREWSEFKTDNGVRVVQFSCSHFISAWSQRAKEVAKEYMSNDRKIISLGETTDYLDMVSNVQKFQFTINNDDTFQIDNLQVRTVWADGKSFNDSQKPLEHLRYAYNNELNFDPAELTVATIPVIAGHMAALHYNAK